MNITWLGLEYLVVTGYGDWIGSWLWSLTGTEAAAAAAAAAALAVGLVKTSSWMF